MKIKDILVFVAIVLTVLSVLTIYTPTTAEWVAYGVCGLTMFIGYMSIRTVTSAKEVNPQMIALRHVIHICAALGFLVSLGFIVTKNVDEKPLLPDGVLYVLLAIIIMYSAIKCSFINEGTKKQMEIDERNVRTISVGIECKNKLLRKIKGVKDELEVNLKCEPQKKRLALARVASLYDNVFSIAPNQLEAGMPLRDLLTELEEQLDFSEGQIGENIHDRINELNEFNNKINRLTN